MNLYKKDLVFIGGVDTQELLPYKSPEEVKIEVRRLKKIFGSNYVVSPSHEALLPNVSIENVIAMREAAVEKSIKADNRVRTSTRSES